MASAGLNGLEDPVALQIWRKQKRFELLRLRELLSTQEHRERSARILDCLSANFQHVFAGIVGFYWPFRGEVTVTPLVEQVLTQGAIAALPVVVAKHHPLHFRPWQPKCAMTRGAYGIPYPAEDIQIVPDVLLVPLVGFDSQCFRLGYGGGFYDRTLSAAAKAILTIGVGFEVARLATIAPQIFDVPMNYIVTEKGAMPTVHSHSPFT